MIWTSDLKHPVTAVIHHVYHTHFDVKICRLAISWGFYLRFHWHHTVHIQLLLISLCHVVYSACCNIWDHVFFKWVLFVLSFYFESMRGSIFSEQSGKTNSIWAIQSRGYLTLHCDIVMSLLQTVLPFLYSFVHAPVKWTFCWSQ